MPYDLYGQYYSRARDAENAETAQCAEIEAKRASKRVTYLEGRMQQLWEYCNGLEERIKVLEAKSGGHTENSV
jgi:hypothetical protein